MNNSKQLTKIPPINLFNIHLMYDYIVQKELYNIGKLPNKERK